MDDKKIILFVDDEKAILRAVKRSLKNENFVAIYVESGITALEVIENNDVAVVVSDIGLPNMSGTELLKKIQDSHPGIVKIALTGVDDLDQVYDIFEQVNLFKYVTKPWDVARFKQLLQDALDHN